MLDLTELLEKIPDLISQLTHFTVFSVYLLDEKREELSIAYAVGYPKEIVKHFTLKVGQGIVGTAVAEQRPILLNDVDSDPRYLAVVPGAKAHACAEQQSQVWARSLLIDQLALHRAREWSCASRRARRAAITTSRLFESTRVTPKNTPRDTAEIGHRSARFSIPTSF